MKDVVVIIGMGEIGGVFARGFLKSGFPVYPILRGDSLEKVADEIQSVKSVVLTVGEKDFDAAMQMMPQSWRDKLVLVQNELLPKDWEKHQVENPTVISVWFEKKQPNDYKVIIPSPVFGKQSQWIAESLGRINIATKLVSSKDDLLFELVLKNLYILTTNICGLKVGGNVGQLWESHQDFARQVIKDILAIQFQLASQKLDEKLLISEMVKAFQGDSEHKCMGRSAPGRLERAIQQADQFKLDIPTLREIHQESARL